MRHELTVRQETRIIGKRVRNDMTQSIFDNMIEGNFKNYAYGNYTKLIYKRLFGMIVKKYREALGLKSKANIRDYLSYEQLEVIQDLGSKVTNIVEFTSARDPKEVYSEVKVSMDTQNIPPIFLLN